MKLMEVQEGDPQAMLHEFYGLQEERIQVYRRLDEGHQAYLQTSPDYDFTTYRQVVHDSTKDFNRISQRVIAMATAFRSKHNEGSIADCLEALQKAEQDKLEKTAALQLSKQRLQDEPSIGEHQREVSELKQKLIALMEKITDIMEDLKYETEGLGHNT